MPSHSAVSAGALPAAQGALPSWCVPFAGPPLLIALAGAAYHGVARGRFPPLLLCWSLLSGLVFSAVGTACLSLLEPTGALSSLSAYLVGFILVSSALLLMAFTSPVSIALNFAVLSGAFLTILLVPRLRDGWTRLSFGKVEAFALLLILLAAGLWSQENLESITVEGPVVVSHPWQDIPFHAVQVSLFAHSNGAAHLSNPLMAGQPVPLYHYASYMVTSLLCRLSGLDAYSLTTGWYAPMALVLTGLAAWSLGASLLGAAGGLGAVFAALLIPDPSYYGLGNRWTSYFFFQTVGISAAYAVAILGMSWALFFTFLRTGAKRVLFAALLLCALSAFFKSLIFLVYSCALLAFAAAFAKGVGRSVRLLLAGLLIANGLGLLVVSQLANAPTLAISSAGAQVNLEQLLNNYPPDSLIWLRQYLHGQPSDLMQQLLGIPIVLLTTYGVWLLACIAAVSLSARKRLHPAWTLFPIFILLNHLFAALCLDSNHGIGDVFEIIHKTFVFPYFAVAAWSAATLLSQFENLLPARRLPHLMIAAAAAVALACVYQSGKSVQAGMLWAKLATHLEVPTGLYDAAQFIRQRTQTDAVVQYSENDERAMLPALAERKSFVVRYFESPFSVIPEEARRVQQVDTLLNLATADAAKGMAAALGIDWLLLADTRQPPWADQLSPEFESHGFRVYRIAASGPQLK